MNEEQEVQLQSGFSIDTAVYSGPLDLLIDLIEKRKLLINDISLAAVTDDYMRYVALIERHPLRETAQFLVLASTLLLIKSKSLLPVLDLTENEEEGVEDLQNRLRLYQLYRNAGKTILSLFEGNRAYERRFVPHTEPIFTLDKYTECGPLQSSLKDVLARLPKIERKQRVAVRRVLSLEEMMDRLRARIERQFTLTFKDFAGESRERGTVIVSFLAVLEMVKQGLVIVRQAERHHDIEIERETGHTPKYH